MADLVERLRGDVQTGDCYCERCLLFREAADEIERMAHDIGEYQNNLDAEVAARLSAESEMAKLQARMEAAPVMEAKTYKERCEDARKTDVGDVWQNIKTSKRVTVIGRSYFHVYLRHESGRETKKGGHYLAGDYFLVVEE